MNISTHTLTWSVTRILLFFAKVEHHFNSHAHVERDVKKTYRDFQKDISTHTLTWSVTGDVEHACAEVAISTHTLTWSVTLKRISAYILTTPFQLTRSRGA